jgi:hypothetical protein
VIQFLFAFLKVRDCAVVPTDTWLRDYTNPNLALPIIVANLWHCVAAVRRNPAGVLLFRECFN